MSKIVQNCVTSFMKDPFSIVSVCFRAFTSWPLCVRLLMEVLFRLSDFVMDYWGQFSSLFRPFPFAFLLSFLFKSWYSTSLTDLPLQLPLLDILRVIISFLFYSISWLFLLTFTCQSIEFVLQIIRGQSYHHFVTSVCASRFMLVRLGIQDKA